jgi:DNA-3-methyladenine glycosylase II
VARALKAHRELAESDPVMARLIEGFGPLSLETRRGGRPKTGAYDTLVRALVGQQLSTKAAATIHGRLLDAFGGETPTPEQLLKADPQDLRAVGLSGRKVEYLRDLGAHVRDGRLDLDRLATESDEEIIEQITAVRGFGRWSAEMFLMFHLERPDVLPVGDLGIRAAIKNEYGLDELPAPAEMERIAERWRPHRTLACIYLWHSLRNE